MDSSDGYGRRIHNSAFYYDKSAQLSDIRSQLGFFVLFKKHC